MCPGSRVVVTAGVDRGLAGTVVQKWTVPTDGRGVPLLYGSYAPWSQYERAVRLDVGRIVQMHILHIMPEEKARRLDREAALRGDASYVRYLRDGLRFGFRAAPRERD
jgi:hypothetical protein